MNNLDATERGLREAILVEATKMFAEEGYSGTSVRQLVEACGCTKPSLYYYFGSKEGLFRAAVERVIDNHTELVERWLQNSGSLRESTHEAIQSFIVWAEENPYAMQLMQRIEMQPEEGAPTFNMSAFRDSQLGMMGQIMERGLAAGELRADAEPMDCALLLAGAVSFQCEIAASTGSWNHDQIRRTINLVFDGIAR